MDLRKVEKCFSNFEKKTNDGKMPSSSYLYLVPYNIPTSSITRKSNLGTRSVTSTMYSIVMDSDDTRNLKRKMNKLIWVFFSPFCTNF